MDGYNFQWNSTVFPNPPGSDVITQTILRFFQNIIQINYGAQFAADAAACGLLNAQNSIVIDGNVCPSALGFPIAPTLKSTEYKFPLLTAYRMSREYDQFTTMKLTIKSEYVVNFILPPLTPDQYNYMYKYLSYAADIIVHRSWEGSDPNYNDGEHIWKTANIAYALFNKDEHGSFFDNQTEFPSIRMHLSIMEQAQDVRSNYNDLTNAFIQTDNVDGYNPSSPVLNVADGYANPNLSILSLNTSSGSVLGGTVVVIIGSAFANVISSQVSSSNVTFNGAPVARLLVKTSEAIVVITGPGAATGTGNVVITDRFGNTTTLNDGWTYE
jgi:IPT/TIG domain